MLIYSHNYTVSFYEPVCVNDFTPVHRFLHRAYISIHLNTLVAAHYFHLITLWNVCHSLCRYHCQNHTETCYYGATKVHFPDACLYCGESDPDHLVCGSTTPMYMQWNLYMLTTTCVQRPPVSNDRYSSTRTRVVQTLCNVTCIEWGPPFNAQRPASRIPTDAITLETPPLQRPCRLVSSSYIGFR